MTPQLSIIKAPEGHDVFRFVDNNGVAWLIDPFTTTTKTKLGLTVEIEGEPERGIDVFICPYGEYSDDRVYGG